MSRYAHQTKTRRKIITLQEWATFLGVSRQTMAEYREKYREAGGDYDPTDIYSILTFYRYLVFHYFLSASMFAALKPLKNDPGREP